MIPSRVPARSAVALLALAVLTGCTGPTTEPTDGTPSPTGSAVLTLTDPDSLRAAGTAVASGDLALTVWPPVGVSVAPPDEDGAVTLTVPLPQIADPTASVLPVATLVPPPGATLDVLGDDSALVRGPDGAVVGALGIPVLAGDAAGAGLHLQVSARDDGALDWSVVLPVLTDGTVDADPTPPGTVTAVVAASALRSATWADRDDEGGLSLAVVPAAWARTGGLAAEEALWTQLVAQVPEADTTGVRDQLTCHTIGAPDKDSWNLEPWRPDVGLLATLAARCNPE